MSSETSAGLSTPMAVLIGSIIIAVALYFGLQSGKNDPLPPQPVVSAPVKDVPTAEQPVPTAKPSPSPDKALIVREATAVLERYKKTLAQKCLAPSLVQKPDPPNVKYLFNITFDAAGKAIARGVLEDRATARPDVLECISNDFPVVAVTPPGQSVLVNVPFELP